MLKSLLSFSEKDCMEHSIETLAIKIRFKIKFSDWDWVQTLKLHADWFIIVVYKSTADFSLDVGYTYYIDIHDNDSTSCDLLGTL